MNVVQILAVRHCELSLGPVCEYFLCLGSHDGGVWPMVMVSMNSAAARPQFSNT